MAKAKKLPSGVYRCLVYTGKSVAGKREYKSFTADTKREAELQAVQFLLEHPHDTDTDMTLNDALTAYIDSKKSVLSQTTLTAYFSNQRNLFKDLSNMKIKSMNSSVVQLWIGSISANHAPKTVKNAYGLLSATLDMFAPNIHLKVKLPQEIKKNLYVPTDDDIMNLMNYLKKKDKDMYIACNIAAFGTLRRSEICALTADDVIGNIIRVNKAMVRSTTGEWIIKQRTLQVQGM